MPISYVFLKMKILVNFIHSRCKKFIMRKERMRSSVHPLLELGVNILKHNRMVASKTSNLAEAAVSSFTWLKFNEVGIEDSVKAKHYLKHTSENIVGRK